MLRKLTLEKNDDKKVLELRDDKTKAVIRKFDTKADGTKGGVLERVLGTDGGSVRIKKENGRFQEERTFPRKKDPRASKG